MDFQKASLQWILLLIHMIAVLTIKKISMDRTYQDDINAFTELAALFCETQDALLVAHPTWQGDVRVSPFSMMLHILNSTNYALSLLSGAESNGIRVNDPGEALVFLQAYDAHIKQSLKLTVSSSVESSLRFILRALDQNVCSNSREEFYKIYKKLFEIIGVPRKDYFELLRLLSAIRNTIHNNGMFFPQKT